MSRSNRMQKLGKSIMANEAISKAVYNAAGTTYSTAGHVHFGGMAGEDSIKAYHDLLEFYLLTLASSEDKKALTSEQEKLLHTLDDLAEQCTVLWDITRSIEKRDESLNGLGNCTTLHDTDLSPADKTLSKEYNKLKKLAKTKANELENNGVIYLQGGYEVSRHGRRDYAGGKEGHQAFIRIKKLPDGSYEYTEFNAGSKATKSTPTDEPQVSIIDGDIANKLKTDIYRVKDPDSIDSNEIVSFGNLMGYSSAQTLPNPTVVRLTDPIIIDEKPYYYTRLPGNKCLDHTIYCPAVRTLNVSNAHTMEGFLTQYYHRHIRNPQAYRQAYSDFTQSLNNNWLSPVDPNRSSTTHAQVTGNCTIRSIRELAKDELSPNLINDFRNNFLGVSHLNASQNVDAQANTVKRNIETALEEERAKSSGLGKKIISGGMAAAAPVTIAAIVLFSRGSAETLSTAENRDIPAGTPADVQDMNLEIESTPPADEEIVVEQEAPHSDATEEATPEIDTALITDLTNLGNSARQSSSTAQTETNQLTRELATIDAQIEILETTPFDTTISPRIFVQDGDPIPEVIIPSVGARFLDYRNRIEVQGDSRDITVNTANGNISAVHELYDNIGSYNPESRTCQLIYTHFAETNGFFGSSTTYGLYPISQRATGTSHSERVSLEDSLYNLCIEIDSIDFASANEETLRALADQIAEVSALIPDAMVSYGIPADQLLTRSTEGTNWVLPLLDSLETSMREAATELETVRTSLTTEHGEIAAQLEEAQATLTTLNGDEQGNLGLTSRINTAIATLRGGETVDPDELESIENELKRLGLLEASASLQSVLGLGLLAAGGKGLTLKGNEDPDLMDGDTYPEFAELKQLLLPKYNGRGDGPCIRVDQRAKQQGFNTASRANDIEKIEALLKEANNITIPIITLDGVPLAGPDLHATFTRHEKNMLRDLHKALEHLKEDTQMHLDASTEASNSQHKSSRKKPSNKGYRQQRACGRALELLDQLSQDFKEVAALDPSFDINEPLEGENLDRTMIDFAGKEKGLGAA